MRHNKLMNKIYLFLIGLLILSSCATTELKQYNQVQKGMDKDQVLSIMGSPRHNLRRDGVDRWTYEFYDSGKFYKKEVHFKDGIAIYVGDEYKDPETVVEEKLEKSFKAEKAK